MSKRAIDAKVSLLTALKKEIGKCERCAGVENLTLDHIVPQQILELFGLEEYEMHQRFYVQLYCRKCNVFKGNRIDPVNPRTKEVFKKLLNL